VITVFAIVGGKLKKPSAEETKLDNMGPCRKSQEIRHSSMAGVKKKQPF
jgi:hypothetical protein